jgi:acyl carrier protein
MMVPTPAEVSLYLELLWAETLDLREVAADADFFAIGGDSMAAIRMIVAVLDRFDVDIDLESFFADPTIRTLQGLVEAAARAKGQAAAGAVVAPPHRSG